MYRLVARLQPFDKKNFKFLLSYVWLFRVGAGLCWYASVMATLVVTASPSRAGQLCVVEHRGSRVEHRSVFDSHGKARFRDLESGLYMVSYGNQTRVTDIAGRSVSCGYARLIAEDREYLAWLELSAEDKLKAIEEGDPIAKWAASIQARRPQ